MFEPEMYHLTHKAVKSIMGEIIKKHFSKIKWPCHINQIYMDVGCGPGDVLMDYIYPLIRDKCNKFICCDISKEMLDYLKEYYKNPISFEYITLDITTERGVPKDLREKIDHLTIINVLQMVQDYSTSLKNIYDLLRPQGGECLIVLMPKNSIYEAYDYLRNLPKWLEYKPAIERCIPPILYSENPIEDFENLLKKTGFTDINIESKFEICKYENLQVFRDGLKSICMVLKDLPTAVHRDEFIDDFVLAALSCASKSAQSQQMDSQYFMTFPILAVSAKRN